MDGWITVLIVQRNSYLSYNSTKAIPKFYSTSVPDCEGLVPVSDTGSDGSQSSGYSASSATHMNSESEIQTFKTKCKNSKWCCCYCFSHKTSAHPGTFHRHLKTHYFHQAFSPPRYLPPCTSDSAFADIVRGYYILYIMKYNVYFYIQNSKPAQKAISQKSLP